METIRVFLSSPGDVTDERQLARQAIRRLQKERQFAGRLLIEEISWDDPDNPATLDARLTPQAAINKERPKPSDCDVVVVILWSRLGTPLPADIRKPDGSPYRSGTEWEFLDALREDARADRRRVWVYRRTEKRTLDPDAPDFEEKLSQHRAVQAFFAEFRDAGGALRHSVTDYDTPSAFEARFRDALREVLAQRLEPRAAAQPAAPNGQPEAPAGAGAPIWPGNPYRGLLAFGPEHAPIFFGRGPETDALVRRVRDGIRVLAVVGASGSGKSSLIAAGLLHRLAAGALPGSRDWALVRFTPAERGDDPFRALALALAAVLPPGGPGADALAERLSREPSAIAALADSLLAGKPAQAELLLFADQFEELFTARVAETHRAPFVALAEAIAQAPRVRLVLSLRADYYAHCTAYSGLAALLRDGSFPLAAPGDRALAEMVEGPARAAGLSVEPGLVAAIARDAGDGPGRLALVEYALETLYDRRRDGTLGLAAYRDELHGIAGLIQSQGDRAAEGTGEAARHELFDALSEVDAKGGAVRRRTDRDRLSPAAQALARRLEDARLLTADRDPDSGRPWLEVAHESVLRDWPLFAQWLDGFRAFKLWEQTLDDARRRWEDQGRKPLHLLSGGSLKEALLKRKERPGELSPDQAQFIDRSRRRARANAGQVAALALAGAVVLAAGGSAAQDWWESRPLLPEMVAIPAGEFCMGSRQPGAPAPADCPGLPEDPEADDDETPARRVRVPAFQLGQYEVTAGEYRRYVKAMQARGQDLAWSDDAQTLDALPPAERALKDRLPAVNVSYEDALAYADWLWEETGRKGPKYRLPTEAEWEYAARAGTVTRRWWGDDAQHQEACAHANVLDRKAWGALKAAGYTIPWDGFACESDGYVFSAPVGRYGAQGANGFGLHDMLGNVWEWVADCYHGNYQGAPPGPGAWVDGAECASGARVLRGGSWNYGPGRVRAAGRYWSLPDFRIDKRGFRLARDP